MVNNKLIDTGNPIVDEVGELNISGNIIPENWYQWIRKGTGKPDLLAIVLLSEIVYWYRPTEVRDEISGNLIGYRKKFSDQFLQKSYNQMASKFGETKAVVKRAMDTLEELGLIRRHVKTLLILPNGAKMANVLYIELVAEKLRQITFEKNPDVVDEDDGDDLLAGEVEEVMAEDLGMDISDGRVNCEGRVKNNPTPKNDPTVKNDTTYKNIPTVKDDGIPIFDVTSKTDGGYGQNYGEGRVKIDPTNTKNTTKTTYGDSIYPIDTAEQEGGASLQDDGMDEIRSMRERISENIDLPTLLSAAKTPIRKNLYQQAYELICDVVTIPRKMLRINGTDYPYVVVKDRFLKLDYSAVEYAIELYSKSTTKKYNVMTYMLTCLYNASMTIDSYYQSEAQHDLYGGREDDSDAG